MHDLVRINDGLQESLSLDKHPVAILIGAGCPCAIRVSGEPLIPDVRGLTDKVTEKLKDDDAFKNVVGQLQQDGITAPTVEDMLSRVRLLARVAGAGTVRGLEKADLVTLEKALCDQISNVVKVELPGDDSAYTTSWIGSAPSLAQNRSRYSRRTTICSLSRR